MRGGGTVNADGFGVGWYRRASRRPVRYRRGRADLERRDASPALAAVDRVRRACWPRCAPPRRACRSAEAAAAPFTDGPLAVQPQRRGRAAGRTRVGAARRAAARRATCSPWTRPTDSALLWALVRAPAARRRRAGRGASPTTVREVAAAAPGSRLNLLLTDGDGDRRDRLGHALSVRARRRRGRWSASEPLRRRPRLARGPRPAPARRHRDDASTVTPLHGAPTDGRP